MAKEKQISSKMNALFKFDEKEWIGGIFVGYQQIKNGRAVLIKDVYKETILGVPEWTTLKQSIENVDEGDYVLLQFKGTERSENTGREYIVIKARAWELEEGEDMPEGFQTNVDQIFQSMEKYEPEKVISDDLQSDEDFPF